MAEAPASGLLLLKPNLPSGPSAALFINPVYLLYRKSKKVNSVPKILPYLFYIKKASKKHGYDST
ncbi:MAG: hypothetical protein AB1351_13245, partial [Thermoproteota archaeon]